MCGKRLAGGVCVCIVTHARPRSVRAVRAERLLPTAAPPSGPSWFSLARPGKVTWTHGSSLAPCSFQRFRISFARAFSPRHGQTSALALSSCVYLSRVHTPVHVRNVRAFVREALSRRSVRVRGHSPEGQVGEGRQGREAPSHRRASLRPQLVIAGAPRQSHMDTLQLPCPLRLSILSVLACVCACTWLVTA